ncbi:hypothetical protein CEQ90_01360 [Lewinellaceae bacterium SD302]|nr:hypothetical protein CEQ90_01360 [Lewinellaceae bacterium SD302]
MVLFKFTHFALARSVNYGFEIHLVESDKRQRKPRSAEFREAWNLIEHWAASEETLG